MLLPALRASLLTLAVTGVAYPLAITGAAQLLFPAQANGSLLADERGDPIGSRLIAQRFAGAGYFQPRPSAAGDAGWDASSSGGSNLGPSSKKLRDRGAADLARLRAENPEAPGPIPAELISASGSGLDPEISPEAARWQLARVARARQVEPSRLAPLIDQFTEARTLGFLGEPRVDVLALNLALDRLLGKAR